MATLKNYGRTIYDMQQTVCNKIGFDLRRGPLEIRALVIAVDAPIALLIALLVSKGVFTDAELNGAIQQARALVFAPLERQPPVMDPMAPADQPLPVPAPLQD